MQLFLFARSWSYFRSFAVFVLASRGRRVGRWLNKQSDECGLTRSGYGSIIVKRGEWKRRCLYRLRAEPWKFRNPDTFELKFVISSRRHFQQKPFRHIFQLLSQMCNHLNSSLSPPCLLSFCERPVFTGNVLNKWTPRIVQRENKLSRIKDRCASVENVRGTFELSWLDHAKTIFRRKADGKFCIYIPRWSHLVRNDWWESWKFLKIFPQAPNE